MGTCPNTWGRVWHCGEHLALWVYCGHGSLVLWPFLGNFGGRVLDALHLKCVILFSDITLLKGSVTSYVMSQHHTCIGHMTFYYKRSTNASVGDSCLLFLHSSGSTLSPETRMWLVPNACGSQCI